MLTAVGDGRVQAGSEALNRLKSTEPPLYLTPSPDLSRAARSASEYLFSSLNPFAPKSPFPRLLTEGFDAEQIWQQIDLQSQPLLSSIRRHVRNFEKNPDEIKKLFNFEHKEADLVYENGYDSMDLPDKELTGLEIEGFDDGTDDNEEGEGEDTSEDDVEYLENANGVEDRHFKIKELEEYLEEDEAREYGLKNEKDKKKDKSKRGEVAYEDEESEDEFDDEDGEDEEDDEDDELGVMGLDDKDGEWMEEVKYDDFFGSKGNGKKKSSNNFGESHHLGMDDDPNNNMGSGSLIKNDPNNHNDNQKNQTLSTHEQERENLRFEIEKMEKANLEPKTWTMQGEVTAAKRPKNSALEVDLDFEHNVRPAPVITEEVTASLEELIQKRVAEGLFDDVQKPPTLSNKAPREKVEMDESKSKKGLAELYEDEYAQKTGLVSTALTFSDEQKKEANLLFKKLCLKLDALSHFHFTPKPVIEDMSIQANVPALAMEEIAPLVVSDAAMLAPQEVFAGKGDIKEETELTKAERKRRRSNKKRKYKAEAVKTQRSAFMNQKNGNEDSRVVT